MGRVVVCMSVYLNSEERSKHNNKGCRREVHGRSRRNDGIWNDDDLRVFLLQSFFLFLLLCHLVLNNERKDEGRRKLGLFITIITFSTFAIVPTSIICTHDRLISQAIHAHGGDNKQHSRDRETDCYIGGHEEVNHHQSSSCIMKFSWQL